MGTCTIYTDGTRMCFENLFCLQEDKVLWVICKPCWGEIWTVAELHNFIEKAVSAKAEEN